MISTKWVASKVGMGLSSKKGFSGHIIRHSTLQHAFLKGKIEGRLSRGRPRTMRMVNITERSGVGHVFATRKAQDMNYWQHRIASDPVMDGT